MDSLARAGLGPMAHRRAGGTVLPGGCRKPSAATAAGSPYSEREGEAVPGMEELTQPC